VQPSYLRGLLGTLQSPAPQVNALPFDIKFQNKLPVPISIFWLDTNGIRGTQVDVLANDSAEFQSYDQDWFIAVTASSGSFVGVVATSVSASSQIYTFDYLSLLAPNDIGPVPQPNSDQPIPSDSPLVLVGCGTALDGKTIIVREQYWQRSPESYCLAPKETRTFSVTIMNGRQETSSDTETVSQNLSTSATGGWGPISASISASLSKTSVHSQQVSVQTQTVRYSSQTLTNSSEKNVALYFKWSLIDMVTILGPKANPLSSVVMSVEPALVSGPFDPAGLAPPPGRLIRKAPVGPEPAALPPPMKRAREAAARLEWQDGLVSE